MEEYFLLEIILLNSEFDFLVILYLSMEEVPLSPIEEIRSHSLLTSSLSSLNEPLTKSLKSNYKEPSVTVVEWPDLRKLGLSRAASAQSLLRVRSSLKWEL